MSPLWFGKPNLLRWGGRGRLPVKRVVNDAPHLGKPPLCATQTASLGEIHFESARFVETEFQLLLNDHDSLLFNLRMIVAGGVGQKPSNLQNFFCQGKTR